MLEKAVNLENKRETALWIFNQGVKQISESDLRHIDRTAYIFVRLLEELNEEDLMNELYEYYSE